MTPPTKAQVEELRRLLAQVSQTDWHWDSDPIKGDPLDRVRFRVCTLGRTVTQLYYSSGDPHAEAEAALICAMKNALPGLLDALGLERGEPVAWMYDVASDGLNACTQSKKRVSEWADRSKIVPLYTRSVEEVPVEPTEEMVKAGAEVIAVLALSHPDCPMGIEAKHTYRAMVSAAPNVCCAGGPTTEFCCKPLLASKDGQAQDTAKPATAQQEMSVPDAWIKSDADILAAAVDHAVRAGHIDARSLIADARLDYGNPFSPDEVEKHLARRRHGRNTENAVAPAKPATAQQEDLTHRIFADGEDGPSYGEILDRAFPAPAASGLAEELERRKGLYRHGRSIPFTHTELDELIAALRSQPAGGGEVDMQELRRALCGIAVIRESDSWDYIRRESVLDIVDRRIADGERQA